jgi:hypothetical protein
MAVFLHSLEVLQSTPSKDLGICIVADPSTDHRQYNPSSIDKVAVILSKDGSQAHQRDIILHTCASGLQFIHDHHPAYAPLHYVLLFPHGTPSWMYDLPQLHNANDDNNATDNGRRKTISYVQFYSYRLYTVLLTHATHGSYPSTYYKCLRAETTTVRKFMTLLMCL